MGETGYTEGFWKGCEVTIGNCCMYGSKCGNVTGCFGGIESFCVQIFNGFRDGKRLLHAVMGKLGIAKAICIVSLYSNNTFNVSSNTTLDNATLRSC